MCEFQLDKQQNTCLWPD